MTDERALVSRTSIEMATALVTGAVGAAVMWGAVEHDIGWGDSGPAAGYFPFRIGILMVLGSLTTSWSRCAPRRRQRAFRHGRAGAAGALLRPADPRLRDRVFLLGLYVAAMLYLVFVMVFQGGYRPGSRSGWRWPSRSRCGSSFRSGSRCPS